MRMKWVKEQIRRTKKSRLFQWKQTSARLVTATEFMGKMAATLVSTPGIGRVTRSHTLTPHYNEDNKLGAMWAGVSARKIRTKAMGGTGRWYCLWHPRTWELKIIQSCNNRHSQALTHTRICFFYTEMSWIAHAPTSYTLALIYAHTHSNEGEEDGLRMLQQQECNTV